MLAMSAPKIISLSEKRLGPFVAGLLEMAHRLPLSRLIIGVAGIPGAGKSTFAKRLLDAIEIESPGIARLVPMDGFHYSDQWLDEKNLRELKGSPQTFDSTAYVELMRAATLRAQALRFPVYDRTIHEAVPDADAIDRDVRIVITEGNYLLLEQSPWSQLRNLINICWFLDTPTEVAKQRLIDRHIAGGRTRADAMSYYEQTDLPNTQQVTDSMNRADFVLRWE